MKSKGHYGLFVKPQIDWQRLLELVGFVFQLI